MEYKVSIDNIHIYDSYAIKGRDFGDCLRQIEREKGNQTIVFDKRTYFSLKMEWTTHNALYLCHFKRSQTKDVDLNYPCDKPEWLYCIVGVLCWIFLWPFLI